jgi:hypothetical protein
MKDLRNPHESVVVPHKIDNNNDKNEFMIVETRQGSYKNIRIK